MIALTIIVTSLVILIGINLIRYLLWRIRADKMVANIPGPKQWPLIGNSHLFANVKTQEDLFKVLHGLYKEYNLQSSDGILKIWIGPKLGIVLCNPKHIEKVLSSKDALQKDPMYQYIGITGNGLFVKNGYEWQELRKPLNKLLNKKLIESNLEMFYEKSIKLCNIWGKYVKTGENVDLRHYITNFSFDALAVSNFGHDINELERDDRNVAGLLERGLEITLSMVIRPPYCFSVTLAEFSKLGRKLKYGLTIPFWNITHEILEGRLLAKEKLGESIDDKPSFYSDVLLQIAKRDKLTRNQTSRLASDFLIAGFDTISVTVSHILLMLAMYPEYQERVYKEIVEVIGKDPDIVPTGEHLSQMSYLTRVIKEAMRLTSPPGIVRRLSNDIDLGDYKLPIGSVVYISFYGMHRNPQIWSHPDEFYPDHFLSEESAKRPKDSYLPFSWGPRSCPGGAYSMALGKVLISTLLRKYKFETDLKFDELKYKYSLLIEVTQGYHVRVKPRNILEN